MKNINLIAMLTVLSGFLAFPAVTEAACFYPNFEDERGRCVRPVETANYYPYHTSSYTKPYLFSNNDSISAYLQELYRLLAVLEKIQAQLESREGTGHADIDVLTLSAANVTDDSARLRGEVDFNGEDKARVYFEWGESRYDLEHRTNDRVREEDEDEESFYYTIYGLDEDETYYFRAVARDEDGDRDYGSIRSFTTDGGDDGRDEEPDVETGDAEDITDHSVKLEGEVDMNDFNNGIAFFVWGEDEDQVKDVEDDYDRYYEIDEDGDDLQKVKVDSDVDGHLNAWARIYNLDDDTDIYYRFCIEYEDEDDDDVITCGDTEDFTTED